MNVILIFAIISSFFFYYKYFIKQNKFQSMYTGSVHENNTVNKIRKKIKQAYLIQNLK